MPVSDFKQPFPENLKTRRVGGDRKGVATTHAVEARDLTVRLGDTTALNGVSLTVDPGEIVTVLGPNGAGKTTLLETVVGILEPDEGRVLTLGEEPPTEGVGYAPQGHSHYDHLTPIENLRFFATMYGAPRDRARELAETFGLPEKRAERLSGGQRRRLDVAIALLPEPDLLVLDEPTEGLDLNSRRVLRDILLSFKEDGGAVLLTTHDPTEAEVLADRVVILEDGRVIAEGPPDELKREVGGRPVLVIEGVVTGEELLPYPRSRVGGPSGSSSRTPGPTPSTCSGPSWRPAPRSRPSGSRNPPWPTSSPN